MEDKNPHETIVEQAVKIMELQKKVSELEGKLLYQFFEGTPQSNEAIEDLSQKLMATVNENENLKRAIARADAMLRKELQWAGQYPGGIPQLEWSLEGLLEKYRALKK